MRGGTTPFIVRFSRAEGAGATWGAGQAPRLPEAVYLQPGQVHVSAAPCTITTIVGSCVSVCLTDRTLGVGGMNHFQLPQRTGAESSARYGTIATRQLIDDLLALGCRPEHLEAKVFGGASIVGPLIARAGHLGAKNVRVAYQILWDAGIPVIAEDVEGSKGRKVIYQTHDGTAWVRRL
jgi:chemotaxis protein CheD